MKYQDYLAARKEQARVEKWESHPIVSDYYNFKTFGTKLDSLSAVKAEKYLLIESIKAAKQESEKP